MRRRRTWESHRTRYVVLIHRGVREHWHGSRGHQRFVDGDPPRLVCHRRGWNPCDRCGVPHWLWITSDWRWDLVPPRWRRRLLCTRCYRAVRRQRT